MSESIRVVETCATLREATAVLDELRAQAGFGNGRVYFDPCAVRSQRFVCEAFLDPKRQFARLGLTEAFDKVFDQ